SRRSSGAAGRRGTRTRRRATGVPCSRCRRCCTGEQGGAGAGQAGQPCGRPGRRGRGRRADAVGAGARGRRPCHGGGRGPARPAPGGAAPRRRARLGCDLPAQALPGRLSVHDGARALLGRLRRQALVPPWASDVVDVVRRVLAVRAWPAWNTRVAVATRLADPARGTLEQALDAGALVRAYAFRGGSYMMTPAVARTLLAVRTTTRMWETARWQAQGGFALADWAPLRAAVREALADGPATRAESAAHLERAAALRPLAPAAAAGAGADAPYRPLHGRSDLAVAPDRDGVSTFRLLSPEPLPATPDVDEAGRRAVLDHLLAYGPATEANLRYWFTDGLGALWRRVHGWL